MISDNIKKYRKQSNMSQDDLAEKLGVSRQSISLWETGQTQPTIDNIIALAKIFNISSDMLLGDSDGINIAYHTSPSSKLPNSNNKEKTVLIISIVAAAIIVGAVILVIYLMSDRHDSPVSGSDSPIDSVIQSDNTYTSSTSNVTVSVNSDNNDTNSNIGNNSSFDNGNKSDTDNKTDAPAEVQFDLFSYCKNFAIEKGTLNGDYCIYQQPSAKYGGYDNEYFSISYWGDSNMVEFCLHCPLSETFSENFYLRMRGGYNKKYEYLSSKYYRDNGESLRSATGYIDPAVFSNSYPISCDKYEGSSDGQNEFMEESRVGICDLISCMC